MPASEATDAAWSSLGTSQPLPDGGDAGPGPSVDASEAASDGSTSGVTSFTVPAAGGSVDLPSAAGKITLTFRASAADKAITLQQGAATALGWTAAQFLDVVKMGSDGTRFTDAVLVKFEKKELVGAVLSFAESGAKAPASPLFFNDTASAFELRHFTALVISPPGKVCDSQGYNDSPASTLRLHQRPDPDRLLRAGCRVRYRRDDANRIRPEVQFPEPALAGLSGRAAGAMRRSMERPLAAAPGAWHTSGVRHR